MKRITHKPYRSFPSSAAVPARLDSVSLTVAALILCIPMGGLCEERPEPKVQQPSKPQPIPFSHKLHVQLSLQCLDCHEMPEPGWAATYPAEAKCMACHASIKTDSPAITKLAEYNKGQRPVPWVQIFRLPDYVFFSHKRHYKKAKITCETCHGPVADREVITKEKPTSMVACMDCHVERRASVTCNSCHNR